MYSPAVVDDRILADNPHNLVPGSIPYLHRFLVDIDYHDNLSLVVNLNRLDSMHLVANNVADNLEAGI